MTAVEGFQGHPERASLRHAFRVVWRNPVSAIGAAALLALSSVAVFAPYIAPHGVDEEVGPVYGSPSRAHPLGLDDAGVDMLSLLIWGARVSLLIGLLAAVISVIVGGILGATAGYAGGWLDTALMRITDMFLVVPTLPLMIVVAAVWGQSLRHVILVIGLLLWTTTARIIRSEVKSIAQRPFIKRARSQGSGHIRIVVRHIVPQVGPLLIANVVTTVAAAIFFEAALAFLGLGDPNHVSWGSLIENAFLHGAITAGAWWAIIPPGLCIATAVLACSLVGQTAEQTLNPRLRGAYVSRNSFRMGKLPVEA